MKTQAEIYQNYSLIPAGFHYENYLKLFTENNFGRYFYNSLIITSITTVVSLFFNSLAGYTFARLNFFGRKFLFFFILLGLMIPNQALIVPQFIIIRNLKWMNTYHGLIIPFISGSFGIFLFRQFFVTVPESFRDAAKIEGCNEFQIYYKIFLPFSIPTLVTLLILKASFTWNDFLYPLIFTDKEEIRTVQLALRYMQGQYSSDFGIMMAATLLISIPPIILFLTFQRYYISGLTSGGIKG